MASLPFSLSDDTDFEIDDIIHLEQYKAAKVTQKLQPEGGSLVPLSSGPRSQALR